jgi:hypothetical protein
MTETLAGDEHFGSHHKLGLSGGSDITVILVRSPGIVAFAINLLACWLCAAEFNERKAAQNIRLL